MLAVQEKFFTEEEYLALEEKSEIKHEYFNGRIYPMQPPLDAPAEIVAMSGGTNTHARLSGRALASLMTNLRGKPCEAVGSDQRVRIEASGMRTYPDVSVYCSDARFEDEKRTTLLEPKVLVEVLSPSTEAYDRGDKFEHYKLISTLTDYILIAQDRVRVEHFFRRENDWVMRVFVERSDVVSLPSIDAALALSDIYEDIDVPSGLLMRREYSL